MWRCPLQGRRGRQSSVTTDQGGRWAFPPAALPKAAAAHGMGLGTFTTSLVHCSWSSCALGLLVWVAAAVLLSLCEQSRTSRAMLSEGEGEGEVFCGCHLWRSTCLQRAFGTGLGKAVAFAKKGGFDC